MIHLDAWSYFWLTVSALSFAWWIWFTVHTFRKLPGQAWKRKHADDRERYVTFTATGIYVDIDRYLKTEAGKAALDRIDRSGP